MLEGIPVTGLGAAARGSAVHPAASPLPFTAGDRHRLPQRVQAPQRRLRCMGKGCLCMGSILTFLVGPPPWVTAPTIA